MLNIQCVNEKIFFNYSFTHWVITLGFRRLRGDNRLYFESAGNLHDIHYVVKRGTDFSYDSDGVFCFLTCQQGCSGGRTDRGAGVQGVQSHRGTHQSELNISLLPTNIYTKPVNVWSP